MSGSFGPGFLENLPSTTTLLQTVRLLGEHKGRQELHKRQARTILETLRLAAVVQSTESSNRIEGVIAPHDRIEQLVAQKTTPANRSEAEIAGYRDVLNTIHANAPHIPLTANTLLQFHRDLFASAGGSSGHWKTTDNEIVEYQPDGTRIVRFRPVAAHLTPDAMTSLHADLNRAWKQGTVDPLVLIPAYVLDLLCIHPFLDGNGRMARLLTLLLLYKGGYEVGRYVSLERIVEDSKDTYYEALQASSRDWHEGAHDLMPWLEYSLGTFLHAYRELEDRIAVVVIAPGAKKAMVADCIRRLPQQFTYAQIERACPGISRPTIHRVLGQLRDAGEIVCVRPGRGAVWEKRDHET